MSEATGRKLPSARTRRFLSAIQDVMGRSGLATILRQAGLQRYTSTPPAESRETSLSAAEYASLTQAIENYYGRGARGTLNRIGHAAFHQLILSRKLRARLWQLLLALLPILNRKLFALNWVARELAEPDGQVAVNRDGSHVVLEDYESDATCGRSRDTEICWVTLGEIQAALKWATGVEHVVTEISCKAKGDPACRFEIGDPLN